MNPWLYLLVINLAAFALYGFDKRCARRGASRVPECVLLLLGFIGGTVGAVVAMFRFRHKTRKTSFQVKFWLLTCLQIGLVLFPPAPLLVFATRFFA